MTTYSKLRLLMRTKVEEPVRELINRNDIPIFEQEIRETLALIKQSKHYLASIKADISLVQDSIEEKEAEIVRRESQTLEALEKDTELAHALAEQIAEDEDALGSMRNRLSQLHALEDRTEKDLKNAVRVTRNHQQHLVLLKANEMQRLSGFNYGKSQVGLNGALTELNESLRSIQERQHRNQTLNNALLAVDQSLEGEDLDQRVKSAGIRSGKHDAQAVLERLKHKSRLPS